VPVDSLTHKRRFDFDSSLACLSVMFAADRSLSHPTSHLRPDQRRPGGMNHRQRPFNGRRAESLSAD